jgi:short subunit dehydrogenase-like uncharacterized protein
MLRRTGETPWVYDMIQKFDTEAKKNKTVLLTHCGIDAVPSDIITYVLVKYIRENYNEGTSSVINSVQSANGKLSGGTATTALTISEGFSVKELLRAFTPFSLSPVSASSFQKNSPLVNRTLLQRVLGPSIVPELGVMTSAPQAAIDAAIVQRSWGLFDDGKYYGDKFRFAIFLRARNYFAGVFQNLAIGFLGISLVLPPVRWLLKKVAPKAGEGSTREEAKNYYLKYKALATSDSGKKVVAKMDLIGDAYYWTGVFLVQAALEVLQGSAGRARKNGGVLTPATLEDGFVDRLKKAGVKLTITA